MDSTYFCQFLIFTFPIPYLNDGLYQLVMVAQSSIFNRDFVTDHKFSMELRYSEFPDQSNTYNLCFLIIAFNFRKCPSHICHDFCFNFTKAFVWMCRTLNWLEWTCSRKAKTADPDTSSVLPMNEKITFIWNQHFFPVFYNPILYVFAPCYLSFIFWVISCFLVVSQIFCQPPMGGVALYLSICELQHASNPSVNPKSSSVHTLWNF